MGIKPFGEHCLQEDKWEKEFEDEIYGNAHFGSGATLETDKLGNLAYCFEDLNIMGKVRIKVRKGCIQIERVD